MSARIVLGLALVLITLSIQAGNAKWLTKLIAEHEQIVEQKEENGSNKKNQEFFSTHGLILFYSSQCLHCKQFAPIVKRWALRYGSKVLPLSFDNQPLPEFPTFLPATTEWVNAAFGSNAINYPAIFIVNPAFFTLYPVGFGSMKEAELNDRIEALIPKIKAYENKGSMQ